MEEIINDRALLQHYLRESIEIVAIGMTNSGKSTALNHLIGTKRNRLLNISETRETNTFWKVKFKDPTEKTSGKFIFKKTILTF